MWQACAFTSKTDLLRSKREIRTAGSHTIETLAVRRNRACLTAVGISLAIALFFIAYPNYVIRPFRQQGSQELLAALFVLRYQRLSELLCAAVALGALGILLRSESRRGARIGAIIAAAVTLLCAGLSRINIYEIMFHPAGAPSFQSISEARLDAKEMLLAVNLNNDSRAYPVRAIAYHHIVNDVAGGIPLVATY